MKILKQNSDNLVIFACTEINLDENGMTSPSFNSQEITSENYSVVSDVSLPDGFTPMGWTYANGEFSVNENGQAALNAENNRRLFEQITALEAQVTNRRLRDAILGTEDPANWLSDQEAAIAALRAQII